MLVWVGTASAQVILTTKEQQTLKALMGPTGELDRLILREVAPQPLATTGHAEVYADVTSHTLKCSFNGGSFSDCLGGGGGGGAPTAAQYWVGAADGTLTAEKNLGVLGTGLVINTAGTPSIFAGTSCTNQFPRSLNASGAATCNSVNLASDVTGILPGGSIAAAGSDRQIQFNNAGVFGAASTLVWTATSRLGLGIAVPLYQTHLLADPSPSGGEASNLSAFTTRGFFLDVSDYATNNKAGLYVNVKQNSGVAAVRQKTGIIIDAYQAPDNGGDVSGIYAIQTGGGNAASFFNLTDNRPAGQTAYPANGWALEVGTGNQTAAALFHAGSFNANAANTQVHYLHNSGAKGIVVAPSDGTSFNTRPAYQVGNLAVNAPNEAVMFEVRLDGHGGFGGPATTANTLRVADDTSLTSSAQLFVSSALSVNGANLVLGGDGVLTPTKSIRAKAGELHFLSDAYGLLVQLSDIGVMSLVGSGRELRWYDTGPTKYVGFKAPATVTTSYTNVPPGAPCANGEAWASDGNAPLQTWSCVAVGGGGAGTITSILGQSGPTITGVNDTNVILTGASNTLTLGWTGLLGAGRLVASPISGGLPYFASTSVVASSALLTNRAPMVGGGVGAAPRTVAAMTDGQVLIGSTGADPVPASITAGANITITPGAGTITISAPAAGTGAPLGGTYLLLNNSVVTGLTAYRTFSAGTGLSIVDAGATSTLTASVNQATAFAWTGAHTYNQQAAITLLPYGVSSGNTGEIRFRELAAGGTNYAGFRAGDALATNLMWVLPIADGTAEQCMKTSGGQVLGWKDCAAGISGSGGAGQATFWSGASTIAGDPSFLWDNAAKKLTLLSTAAGVSGMAISNSAIGSGAAQDLVSTDTGGGTWRFQSLGNVSSRVGNFGIVRVGIGSAVEITPTLRVGVGTQTPSAQLDVVATSANNAAGAIHFLSDSSGTVPTQATGGLIAGNFSSGGLEVDFWNLNPSAVGGFWFHQRTGVGTRLDMMIVRPTGVGIFTAAPGGPLDVMAPNTAADATFTGIIRASAYGPNNGVIGVAINNLPACPGVGCVNPAFPTGTTGYGRVDNNGNQAFGLFGRADLMGTGVATNEFNSFNFGAAPTPTLPPNRAIGTLERLPITMTVAAGGNFDSAIAMHIVSTGRQYLTGIYFDATGVTTTGNYMAADNFIVKRGAVMGLGTLAPIGGSGTLHLSAAGEPALVMGDTTGTATHKLGRLVYDGGSAITGGGWAFQKVSDAGAFVANLVTIIQDTGFVGLGTTAPTSLLHLLSSSPTDLRVESSGSGASVALVPASNNSFAFMNLGSSAGAFGWQVGKDVNAGSLGGANGFYVYELNSGLTGTRLAINSGGNIGFGNINPGTRFDLSGAMTMRGMAAPAVSASGQGRIYFDSTANVYKVSQHGGAYVNLVGGGGSSQWTTLGADIFYDTGSVYMKGPEPAADVRRFGAVCDGVTPGDHVGIQAALNSSAGIIRIPAGSTCLVGATITAPSNKKLVGAGWSSSIIKRTSFTGPMFLMSSTAGIWFEYLGFDQNGAAQNGFEITGTTTPFGQPIVFNYVSIYNAARSSSALHAMIFNNSVNGTLTLVFNSNLSEGAVGIRMLNTAPPFYMRSAIVKNLDNACVYARGGFVGLSYGVAYGSCGNTIDAASGYQVHFRESYSEGTTNNDFKLADIIDVKITDSYFAGPIVQDSTWLDLTGDVSNMTVIGNTITNYLYTGGVIDCPSAGFTCLYNAFAVHSFAPTHPVLITGNAFDNITSTVTLPTSVLLYGNSGGVGNLFATAGPAEISNTLAGDANDQLRIISGGSSGANIKLLGNGGVTPNKYIRARDGKLEFVNSGYTQIDATLNEGGLFDTAGGFSSGGLPGLTTTVVVTCGTLTFDGGLLVNKGAC